MLLQIPIFQDFERGWGGQLLLPRDASQFSVPSPLNSPAADTVQFLSVITPVYDEEKNIPLLVDQLFEVPTKIGKPFEIIAINDGSHDGSVAQLLEQAARPP
jgi:hypothetical protein